MIAAEDLFVKHDRDRGDAHRSGKRMADKIISMLYAASKPNTFAAMDCDDLLRSVQDFVAKHEEYIAADLAVRKSAPEAMNG